LAPIANERALGMGILGESCCSVLVFAPAVVAQRGHRLDESALIAACRAELARYKCPTSVRLLDELPRNATGKVLPTHAGAQAPISTPQGSSTPAHASSTN
jgi:non-ribosomal peptide synthetase component E (peptide arylation enzyme)